MGGYLVDGRTAKLRLSSFCPSKVCQRTMLQIVMSNRHKWLPVPMASIHLLVESKTSRQNLVFEADTTRMTGIRLLLILMGPNWNIVTVPFTPVLAKHTKSFTLFDTLSVGVDRIQRNFEPM
jgi:hypothetical protein